MEEPINGCAKTLVLPLLKSIQNGYILYQNVNLANM